MAHSITQEEAQRLLLHHWGIDASQSKLRALPSERDQNFSVDDKYVLKACSSEEKSLIEAQSDCMDHLWKAGIDCIPRVMAPRNPSRASGGIVAHGNVLLRVLTYVKGTPLARSKDRSQVMFASLGALMARTHCCLAGFDRPALHRPHFQWDLRNYAEIVAKHPNRSKAAIRFV